jgi:N-hydroxyarylamine O-acetyltransferase
MSEDINLNAYFERIGFAGSIAPNLQTLQALHAAHPVAIPFENLNPLMGQPVRLDQRSLEQKLVHERRGGYCFEHNLLFMGVLRTLGYEVKPLAARVLWNHPADAITMRSHMLLSVDIGGASYYADVGFGGLTMTAPLRNRVGVEQETPHEEMRLSGEDPALMVEANLGGEWQPLFRFDLSDQYEIDFIAPNWYASTHPDSIFRTGLMAARAGKDRRLSLRNTTFTIRPLEGEAETQVLGSLAELKEVLSGPFRIALPPAELLDPALERVLQAAEERWGIRGGCSPTPVGECI